nr:MAG TPA: hypothetical protein [Caudoviricetes sp.]
MCKYAHGISHILKNHVQKCTSTERSLNITIKNTAKR